MEKLQNLTKMQKMIAGAAVILVRSEQPVPPRTRAILIQTTLKKEGP